MDGETGGCQCLGCRKRRVRQREEGRRMTEWEQEDPFGYAKAMGKREEHAEKVFQAATERLRERAGRDAARREQRLWGNSAK